MPLIYHKVYDEMFTHSRESIYWSSNLLGEKKTLKQKQCNQIFI